jgi:hypothetical protein
VVAEGVNMPGTQATSWRFWAGSALLLLGGAIALVLLRIDLGVALAGVAIVAVGVALVGAQVAVLGSWLPRRTPPSDDAEGD